MPKEEETTVREVLQVRYGEIFLKGLNRPTFLRMLVDLSLIHISEPTRH